MGRMLGIMADCVSEHCGCPGHTNPRADEDRRRMKRRERQALRKTLAREAEEAETVANEEERHA